MNFLRYFLIIVAIILFSILGFGLRSDGYFREEFSVKLGYRPDFLWEIITDQDIYTEIKRGLNNVDYLETNSSRSRVIEWQENYTFFTRNYKKVIRNTSSKKDVYYDTEILENDLGYTGLISYNFSDIEGSSDTELTIVTNLYVSNIFLRGLYVLRGDNTFSENEVKWIRVGIGKKLLETI